MKPEEVAEMLKPCPFCGGKALYIEVKPEMIHGFIEGFANGLKQAGIEVPPIPSLDALTPNATSSCHECNFTMTKTTSFEIVRAWNFRPEENRLKELAKGAHASLSAQVEIERDRREKLWALLDDIDTAADMAKDDAETYRRLVTTFHQKRFKIFNPDTDGRPAPAASPAPEWEPDGDCSEVD